ncbi:MAG: copper resistance system multicopper oxidase [Methylococcales bacterium]
MCTEIFSRRLLLKCAAAFGLLVAVELLIPGCARRDSAIDVLSRVGTPSPLSGNVIDLTIAETPFSVDGQTGTAVTVNGTIPGPLVRLREGQNVTLRVTNRLEEPTSIHWHGLLVPPEMDGVPGVAFGGIKPGETFIYRFPVRQSGTYWFHSHSGGQEISGVYGPLIIDPTEPEPFRYERDYVVMLSDWSFESPKTLLANLKKWGGYYNFQKRTAGEFFSDIARSGWLPALGDYLGWDRMRMDPTDFADITAYTATYLMNGLSPAGNWTGLFRRGERVRLRFIDAASMTFYDVRIPGLKMTVVQVDGQNVQPVVVDEFRLGPAETYDVVVEPAEDRAYTIFAETMDRSGYARGTLAPRPGMSAEIPERRPRPLRTMVDMGMDMNMPDMKKNAEDNGRAMPGMGSSAHMTEMAQMRHGPGMHDGAGMSFGVQRRSKIPGAEPVKHGPDDHGTGNQTVAESSWNRMQEPGRGLQDIGRRELVYTDLQSLSPSTDRREPEREIELHLTGQMDRYMWSFDGKKYSDAPEPIRFRYGERVRFTFVNDTMMEHPLHLHGMWMELENGTGGYLPRKHTVIVKPAERLSVAISADAPGRWAFHCHLLLHMDAGMFRVVEVSDKG